MLGHKFYPKIASNKWWDKYKGEDNVLIEDMDTSHNYQGYYLKIWADEYAFPVEVKNSGDWIRPKVIIVTSNYPIEQVFPDPSIHKPLLERFKVIHKTVRWNANVFTELMPVDDSFEEEEKVPNNAKARVPKGFTAKPLKKKFRRYDKPLKKPALYRQDADGDIVPNHQKQPLVSLALQEAQLIAAQPDTQPVINIIDSDSEDEVPNPYNEIPFDEVTGDPLFISGAYDQCEHCNAHIIDCICMESEGEKLNVRDYNSDSDYFPSDDECSEDLFDI